MKKAELDLCYLTATEALEKFKSRELSPVELTNALIKRCEEIGPKVNAMTYTFFDEARKAARAAEKKYKQSKGARPKPLEGIPIAIKDFHSIKGRITTYGSKAFEGHKPDNTAPTVDRLLKAGSILLGRTTTPEFAHSGITQSPLWGITRNPWNLNCTPGGSSGGAGASIAGGMVTISDGTDGGGSCRMPAAFSGCVGYKPPFGRNPSDNEHPLETLLVHGPITRSVGDAALMQNVMSGYHPSDQASLKEDYTLPLEFESIRGMKIAYSMDLNIFEIAPDVEKNTLDTIKALRRMGAKVEEVDLGWDWGMYDAWYTRWEGAFAGLIGELLPRWRFEMTPFCLEIASRGMEHSAARFYRTNAGRQEQWNKLEPVLKKYDALLCPTVACSSLPVTHDDGGDDFEINGKKMGNYLGYSMTWPFNNMNWCPVLSVPSGFGDKHMPTGIQICGRTFDDHTVFKIAAAIERARPWIQERPKI
ncbi:MAG: amidase [Pseudomonadota bacterium]